MNLCTQLDLYIKKWFVIVKLNTFIRRKMNIMGLTCASFCICNFAYQGMLEKSFHIAVNFFSHS